ncbi:MAG: hypothetical protein ACI8UQ_000214 [Bacteroidia bacterium]|jgi:uncharacterized protein (DUF2147 family)
MPQNNNKRPPIPNVNNLIINKMKKIINVFLLMAISLFSISSLAQSGVEGEWVVGEQNTVIKIEQQNGIYLGKIVSSDNPKAQIGKPMVKELKLTKGKWKGKVYSPQRKEWYDAEFVRKGNKLAVEVSVGFFSKTTEWTKKQV